jgi:serine protease Do
MSHRRPVFQFLLAVPLLCGLFLLQSPAYAANEKEKAPLTKTPATVSEMRELEKKVKEVAKKVMPAVVGVQVGGASGSGVIVSEDGYVLTAGHVSGTPNRDCTLIMPDGRRIKGKTLGQNRGIDSGMIKITTEGKWPFAPLGDSNTVEKGEWCVSLGHPGGYHEKRSPVLRLGRVLNKTDNLIQTDCTLVGGDSGGPLFNLDGKVIGIHSRIGPLITFNIHVPVSTYTETWDRLAEGESWGNMFGGGGRGERRVAPVPSTGLSYQKLGDIMRITEVEKDSPAEKAGFKARDLIEKLDGKKVADRDEIDQILKKKKAGEEVSVEVRRAGELLTLKLVLGKPKS